MRRPRWDIDERGKGVTDGTRLLPGVAELRAAMSEPNWVAEEPEAHLLPHVERFVAASRGRWRLLGTRNDDGLLELDLAWSGHERGGAAGRLRAEAFALIGEIAESSTFVQERILAREAVFEVTTGMPDGDGPFAPHGHLLRLRIRLPSSEREVLA